jgi:hypothetical protein
MPRLRTGSEHVEVANISPSETGPNHESPDPTEAAGPAGRCPGNPPSAPQARRLSEELQRLVEAFAERSVRLREVLEVMHGRGYTMLLVVVTFPFCTPLPMPGLSIPFGLVVAFIGLRLSLGQKPWLPARLLDTALPASFVPRVLAAARYLVQRLERILKPRAQRFLNWRFMRHAMGIMIFVCGLLMMLPLPIPFSNGLPAMSVLLLSAAILEQDGYVAMAGGGVFVVTLGYFAAIFWGGAEVVELLSDRFGGFLPPDDLPAQPRSDP